MRSLARLRRGEVLALVSDAGTPLLSDPGFVAGARRCGGRHRGARIPGPSAVTAALTVAGLPTDRFVFEGFLPARAGERRAALARLAQEPRTLVLFEAPHRIAATLQDLAQIFGARARRGGRARAHQAARDDLSRHAWRNSPQRARSDADIARGEITLVIAGAPASERGRSRRCWRARCQLLLQEPAAGARRSDRRADCAGVPRSERLRAGAAAARASVRTRSRARFRCSRA